MSAIHEDPQFESADAGASHTIPMQAGNIRKNGYICIKGRPCKVVDVSTSKTGKHGHAKCHFVAVDIFNAKKYEDLTPSTHNCDVPNIGRQEYQVVDINEDGYLSLMLENGETREDLKLPETTDDLKKLAAQIRETFESGADIFVTVVSAMGEEQIQGMKTVTNN